LSSRAITAVAAAAAGCNRACHQVADRRSQSVVAERFAEKKRLLLLLLRVSL
jgi:hypothetical protein